MATPSRITLADYSSKYKVSISTLRRRIKAKSIDFELKDGKYFILDNPPHYYLGKTSSEQDALHALDFDESSSEHEAKQIEDNLSFHQINQLLYELKRTYTQILHEKELQIMQLKEEIADLKTLVKVLEDKA